MTGRTNASAGGGAKLELLWTNPSPSSNFSGTTISASDYIGFVVDAKRYTSASTSTYLRNFVATGTTQQLCGGSYEGNSWFTFCTRTATATINNITISATSDGVNGRCIPLRVYGIK